MVYLYNYSGAELYKRLQPYILTDQLLKENGYPLPNPDAGGCAMFYTEKKNKDISLKRNYILSFLSVTADFTNSDRAKVGDHKPTPS